MTAKPIRIALLALLSVAVFASSIRIAATPADEGNAPTKAAAMSESELRNLVSPIALYPDNLVAEILAASTFPDQIAIASYWLQQHKNLTGSALVHEVDSQSWDASVKALTQFPTVLDNMAKSLSWTSQLGEAYHNQKSEIMSAIQALRAQAKAAGHLNSSPQMKVEQQSPNTIAIEPANSQVVYVPQYNPAVIYGYPYEAPGYTGADLAAASLLSFGSGVALGAFAGGGGWGWNSWGCNWSGGSVTYNHNTFVGNRAWHGGYAGSAHPYGFDGGYHPYGADRADLNRDLARNDLNHFSDANSWAHHDNWAGKSTAFSGLHGASGGFGGWSSRADSSRGWGSMVGSRGFSGFHGFGGGGFHGGGFHGGRR